MLLRRSKGWIGIDLGTRALKLAQAKRVGSSVRIEASVVLQSPEPPDADQQAGVQACRWRGEEILAALSLGAGFSGRRVACVLPMCATDFHALTIPPGGDADRRAMIAHELSAVFGGDRQPREFDFWESAPAAAAESLPLGEVNVLSTPRKLVSEVVSRLAEAGLSCEVMDGLPFALSRAITLSYGPLGRAPVGAVDWGFSSGTFCVVVEGTPLFTRHLRSCGLGRLARAVSRALSLAEDEAMRVLVRHGLPGANAQAGTRSEMEEVLAEIVAPHLSEMAEELNKTISYVRMKYPSGVPERLCLFGNGATVRNVTVPLSKKVGLPVEVWRLPASTGENGDCGELPLPLLGAAVALSAMAWVS